MDDNNGYIELSRKFLPYEPDTDHDSESLRIRSLIGGERLPTWDDLFTRYRVIVLAEPGTGKTEEFKAAARRLREKGDIAFFCRIERLQEPQFDVRDSFDIGSSDEFDAWLSGDAEGFFFLDSVDEARLLSHTAYETALKILSLKLGKTKKRSRVYLSCRVSEWRAIGDQRIFNDHFPLPESAALRIKKDSDEIEAERAFDEGVQGKGKTVRLKDDQIVFQLAPLDAEQIRIFAVKKGINNADDFMNAIDRADAGIFAERPQDLIGLIDYWKSQGCFGLHAEMMKYSIDVKLKEHNPDKKNSKPLSCDEAIRGARNIAAAATFVKKNSIVLPDKPVEPDLKKISVVPEEVLKDWESNKIQTLLDRAIFDESIYGTVRFHHRSVREYLTAQWLLDLLKQGKSRRRIESLIFAEQYGRNVVVPSLRPIAAWMAITDESIRNRLMNTEPEVLIEYGDPSSLPLEFRKSLLYKFAEIYKDQKYTGTSFDITMVRRLADNELSSTVNELLDKYRDHPDLSTLLLKMIWQGRMTGCAETALSYAIHGINNIDSRIYAIRAVSVVGTQGQKINLVDQLVSENSKPRQKLMDELCKNFFPGVLTIGQLMKIIEKSPVLHDKYASIPLRTFFKVVINQYDNFSVEQIEQLVCGFAGLLNCQPYCHEYQSKISERYAWILPITLRFANKLIHKRHEFSLNPIVLDLFYEFLILKKYNRYFSSDTDGILEESEKWPEFRYNLFWQAITKTRQWVQEDFKDRKISIDDLTHLFHLKFLIPGNGDLDRLFESLEKRPIIDDRLVALSAILHIYKEIGRPRALLERIKRGVAGSEKLKIRLNEFLHPQPLSEEYKDSLKEDRKARAKFKASERKKEIKWLKWKKGIMNNPDSIKHVIDSTSGNIHMNIIMINKHLAHKKNNIHKYGIIDWKILIEDFGEDVAKNFRDVCVDFWRGFDPFNCENHKMFPSFHIGLNGLAMESHDDPDWAKKISEKEAVVALHYSVLKTNGFPRWFFQLNDQFPAMVRGLICEELRRELSEGPADMRYPRTLNALIDCPIEFRSTYKPYIFNTLQNKESVHDNVLQNILKLLLDDSRDEVFTKNLAGLACKRFLQSEEYRKIIWLTALFSIDGFKGLTLLKEWVEGLPSVPEKEQTMIRFCKIFTDHGTPCFKMAEYDYERIEVLKELVPFIYRFVNPANDACREGMYTPDDRDYAERTRSHLMGKISGTSGRLSYDALIELSKSDACRISKDYLEHAAKERAALDAEFSPWSGQSVYEFRMSAEKAPESERDLFMMALDRLDDLKMDIENGDDSMAATLQKETEETKIRTIFTNQLKKLSRSRYTIGPEEEFADGKRTDIRLHAHSISAPVPIELKVSDKWTYSQLLGSMEKQLIKQYMRVSRFGIFLIVFNGNLKRKTWQHPISREKLSFENLIESLKEEADLLVVKYTNISLSVIGIDFTARFREHRAD